MKKQRIPLDPRWENVVSFACVKTLREQHSRLQRPFCAADIVAFITPEVKCKILEVKRMRVNARAQCSS